MTWDANELANALVGDYGIEYIKEAAAMLRQLQAEIDLEKKYQKRNVELQQMIIKLRAEIKELTVEVDTHKNLNRKLYGVVGWIQENRPDVWEDMMQWIKNEKAQEK